LISNLGNETKIGFKKGNGVFDRKGSLVIDSTLIISSRNKKQFENLKSKVDFLNLRNSIFCHDSEWWLPNTFFVEIKSGEKYNVFTITECNLESSENDNVFRLFKYLIKLFNDKTDIDYRNFNKYPNR
jgi:hypothetical protein